MSNENTEEQKYLLTLIAKVCANEYGLKAETLSDGSIRVSPQGPGENEKK